MHVKLVSEVGVGTVAAGVSKAHADVVLISGHDGGTGAAPLTSLKHAGAPLGARPRRDPADPAAQRPARPDRRCRPTASSRPAATCVIAALLGAEEFGFATAPLVVSGCIMMRVCHLDTCPVGVATQNPELRDRFTGKPEFVVNFFEFIAEEVRELLAELGFRTIEEAVGQVEHARRRPRPSTHWKAAGLDLSPIFHLPELPEGTARRRTTVQDHGLAKALDNQLIELAHDALEDGTPVRIQLPVRNVNRTVGTMLGHEVTKQYGGAGLPDDTIDITLTGSAGQSLGAFLPRGITLRLEGDANDYVGKGLSGGRDRRAPGRARPPSTPRRTSSPATSSATAPPAARSSSRGTVGERFAVRNSGATLVVEGVGDHALEYMTGGRVVILGEHGRNIAAGMSGGIAYVLDLEGRPGQPRAGRRRGPRRRGPRVPARRRQAALRGDRLAGRRRRCWPTGRAPSPASPRSCPPTTSGCSAPGPPPSARACPSSETLDKIMEATHG